MKRFYGFLLIVFLFLIMVGTANAVPFPWATTHDYWNPGHWNGIPTANDNNSVTPDIFDAFNQLRNGPYYSRNYELDDHFIEPDYIWQQLNGSIAVIGLTANYSNALGVYTDLGVGNLRTEVIGPYSGYGFLGDGTLADPYPGATIALPSHSLYGWYLASSGTNYFSEVGLNAVDGGLDHLMTFRLPELTGSSVYIDLGSGAELHTFVNPYLITWEDIAGGGDEDYNDLIYVVDKVTPVPEPQGLALLATGLVLAATFVRSRRRG